MIFPRSNDIPKVKGAQLRLISPPQPSDKPLCQTSHFFCARAAVAMAPLQLSHTNGFA